MVRLSEGLSLSKVKLIVQVWLLTRGDAHRPRCPMGGWVWWSVVRLKLARVRLLCSCVLWNVLVYLGD